MKLFNHVQIKVADLEVSRQFYDAVMKCLGYGVVLEIPGTVIGFGTSPHDMFEIRQETPDFKRSEQVHIALNAPSREAVGDFYHVALDHGGICHGPPGVRDYEPGYYAAFVLDPDGHNIEAVHSSKASS